MKISTNELTTGLSFLGSGLIFGALLGIQFGETGERISIVIATIAFIASVIINKNSKKS